MDEHYLDHIKSNFPEEEEKLYLRAQANILDKAAKKGYLLERESKSLENWRGYSANSNSTAVVVASLLKLLTKNLFSKKEKTFESLVDAITAKEGKELKESKDRFIFYSIIIKVEKKTHHFTITRLVRHSGQATYRLWQSRSNGYGKPIFSLENWLDEKFTLPSISPQLRSEMSEEVFLSEFMVPLAQLFFCPEKMDEICLRLFGKQIYVRNPKKEPSSRIIIPKLFFSALRTCPSTSLEKYPWSASAEEIIFT